MKGVPAVRADRVHMLLTGHSMVSPRACLLAMLMKLQCPLLHMEMSKKVAKKKRILLR